MNSSKDNHPLRVTLVYDHIFPISHGGAERVYRLIADEFAKRNFGFTYLTSEPPGGSQFVDAGFQIRNIWRGQLYDSSGNRKVFSALSWTRKLLGEFRHLDSDVLLVSATPLFNVLAAAIFKKRNKRTLLTIDWLELWSWSKWSNYSGYFSGTVAWILQNIAKQFGDLILVNSELTRSKIPKRKASKVFLLPLATLSGPPVSRLPPKVPNRLLFVGRHIPDKNLNLLPQVMNAITKVYPDATAVVIGDGPETKRVREISNELGLEHRISFLGRVSDQRLAKELGAASLLFFPSVREGFGLVVCEAARLGTPSVVVDHPDNAAASLIQDGINGSVSVSAEISDLTSAVISCLAQADQIHASTASWYSELWKSDHQFGDLVDRVERDFSLLTKK